MTEIHQHTVEKLSDAAALLVEVLQVVGNLDKQTDFLILPLQQ